MARESKIRKRINEIYEENELANLEASRTRARSFTVGTAFGGIVEVGMRGDFSTLYCLLQPVEAVEFIEQLAAAAGLQVALRPKQDFSTWRGWNVEADDRYWVGAARWQVAHSSENAVFERPEDQNQLPGAKEQINEEKESEEISQEDSVEE
jgi:hypothetical protein